MRPVMHVFQISDELAGSSQKFLTVIEHQRSLPIDAKRTERSLFRKDYRSQCDGGKARHSTLIHTAL
jgi:hypothetical protein